MECANLIAAKILQPVEDFHLDTKVEISLNKISATILWGFFLRYFKIRERLFSNKGRMMQNKKRVIQSAVIYLKKLLMLNCIVFYLG